MQAAITAIYGSPEVLEVREVPRASAAAGQVLVEVRAAAVTGGDRRLRAADFPSFSAVIGRLMFGLFAPRRPVQGTMFAGRVVEVGEGVEDYAIGDDVFGSVNDGAYAEYLSVDVDGAIARMPANVDYAQAANMPYGGVTALRFLEDVAQVQPGETVLIIGASGGVGRVAVQLARHLGATVTAVCSARHAELVKDLGAHHVIDYQKTDVTRGAQTYDVIFDIAGATSFGRSRRILSPRGRYLTVYLSMGILGRMLTTRLFGSKRAHLVIAMGTRADLQRLHTLVDTGVLRSVVDARHAFEDIATAHAAVDQGQAGVVVTMGDAASDASTAAATPASTAVSSPLALALAS